MKLSAIAAFAAACTFFTSATIQADDIVFEDFEDSTVSYTTSVADDLSEIGSDDYYGRIAPDTASLNADISYSNLQGSGFYGAQDTDGVASTNIDEIQLEIFGINVSNYENLAISFFVAEDDAADGNEDWDSVSSVNVQFQIDGGGFVDFFAIESEAIDLGGGTFDRTNERPLVDTDFNGDGDGTEITDVFTQFGGALGVTGSTLDVRFSIEFLDSGDEDIALDNILIEGDFVGVPEPTSMTLLVALSGVMALVRRR